MCSGKNFQEQQNEKGRGIIQRGGAGCTTSLIVSDWFLARFRPPRGPYRTRMRKKKRERNKQIQRKRRKSREQKNKKRDCHIEERRGSKRTGESGEQEKKEGKRTRTKVSD